MLLLTLVLAIVGGLLLALDTVLPGPLVAVGLVLWLAALVLVVVQAVGRARRERRSFGSALWSVGKDVARFVWHFTP